MLVYQRVSQWIPADLECDMNQPSWGPSGPKAKSKKRHLVYLKIENIEEKKAPGFMGSKRWAMKAPWT